MDKILKIINENKKVILIGFVVIIFVIVISFISSTFSTNAGMGEYEYLAENMLITNDEIKNVISNKDAKVIYVVDSNDGNVFNYQIASRLKDKSVSYSVYDINEVDNSTYKSLLSMLDIDYDLFGSPAIIYIDGGIMFANIIHINDLDVVDRFISDYDLSNVK